MTVRSTKGSAMHLDDHGGIDIQGCLLRQASAVQLPHRHRYGAECVLGVRGGSVRPQNLVDQLVSIS